MSGKIHSEYYRGVSIEVLTTELGMFASIKIPWRIVPRERLDDVFPEPSLYELPSGPRWYWGIPDWAMGLIRGVDTFEVTRLTGDLSIVDSRVARLGWDYMHLWDEGVRHSFDDAVNHARANVDCLIDRLDLMEICPWCGKPGRPKEEGWINPGFGKWTPIHPECNRIRVEELRAHGKDEFARPIGE